MSSFAQNSSSPPSAGFNPEQETKSVNPADLVHWKAISCTYDNEGNVQVHVNLKTDQSFSLYSNHLQVTSRSAYDLIKITAPKTESIEDPISAKKVEVYTGGDFIFHFQGKSSYEKNTFPLSLRYIACSSRICLFPYTEELSVSASPQSKEEKTSLAVLTSPPVQAQVATHLQVYGEDQTLEEKLAEHIRSGELNLLLMLFILLLGGLLTNLTPCVYPMIPITIRLLSQQTRKPLHASFAYAGGIVLIYSVLGLSVAYTGSLFGQYMSNPLINIVLAFIMFFLGFSMLGFGNWTTLTKLGHKIGIDKPSILQAFFMGCGAGLVASPCTGPILASILTYIAAHKDLTKSTLFIFTYSVGFALPYVLLGDLSGNLSKRKVSPKIQNFVKVFFASIMFALSFYYLRIPLYEVFASWKNIWGHLGWISGFLGVLVWRILWTQQKHKKLKWFMTVPAFLLGASFFTSSRWFFEEKKERHMDSHIVWYDNEEEALANSKNLGVPLIIDFWAEWCAACKKMDVSTFSDERFIKEAQKYNTIYLKIDVTQSNEENTKLLEKYKVQGLPTIVIIKPGADQASVVSGYASAARLLNYLNE